MGFKLAKCPSCGGDLNLETDGDYFFCPHCGVKVVRDDDRIVIEHVNRSIDEAKLKEIELEHEKFNHKTSKEKKALICALIAFSIGGVLLLLGSLFSKTFPLLVSVAPLGFAIGVVFLLQYLSPVLNNLKQSQQEHDDQ